MIYEMFQLFPLISPLPRSSYPILILFLMSPATTINFEMRNKIRNLILDFGVITKKKGTKLEKISHLSLFFESIGIPVHASIAAGDAVVPHGEERRANAHAAGASGQAAGPWRGTSG